MSKSVNGTLPHGHHDDSELRKIAMEGRKWKMTHGRKVRKALAALLNDEGSLTFSFVPPLRSTWRFSALSLISFLPSCSH
jgi:hypothetical protein